MSRVVEIWNWSGSMFTAALLQCCYAILNIIIVLAFKVINDLRRGQITD